jgi:hypothetical protein
MDGGTADTPLEAALTKGMMDQKSSRRQHLRDPQDPSAAETIFEQRPEPHPGILAPARKAQEVHTGQLASHLRPRRSGIVSKFIG